MYRREALHVDSSPTAEARRCDEKKLRVFCQQLAKTYRLDQIVFVCIGTDRSTGDALGPLVGSMLEDKGCPHVIGTMPAPCDATNLKLRVQDIPEDKAVVAIDACLGQLVNVGCYLIAEGPLQPAESVGVELPAIGDYSIAAVVNEPGVKPYWSLQTTSLHRVMCMSKAIANAIIDAFEKTQCNPKS